MITLGNKSSTVLEYLACVCSWKWIGQLTLLCRFFNIWWPVSPNLNYQTKALKSADKDLTPVRRSTSQLANYKNAIVRNEYKSICHLSKKVTIFHSILSPRWFISSCVSHWLERWRASRRSQPDVICEVCFVLVTTRVSPNIHRRRTAWYRQLGWKNLKKTHCETC